MNELYNVYDLFYPSPPTLGKIAMIKVAIELWRQEIRNHCANSTLKQLNFEKTMLSSVINSYVPKSILATVKEYIESIGFSIKQWIKCHTECRIFPLEILGDFNDFVGDFDGSIDYEKTAKKMILCDRISQVEKFKIACLYCFEDEIALLWHSVSTRIDLGEIQFSKCPPLYYWICRLKNQLYLMPERSLIYCFRVGECSVIHQSSWSSVKYLFDRVDLSERVSYLSVIFPNYPEQFYRYVLAKLNEREFDELLKERQNVLSNYVSLYRKFPLTGTHKVMAVWMYVKNKMNKIDFGELIKYAVHYIPISGIGSNEPSIGCRLYASAPVNFKQYAIKRAFLKNSFFAYRGMVKHLLSNVPLLLAVFRDVSYHDRKAFLNKHWSELIFVMNIDEFHQFVTLCFENEEEINHFRETCLSNYEKMDPHFFELFKGAKLEKLNDLISYCFTEEESMRDIRLRFLNEDFSLIDRASEKPSELMKEPRALNEFINDAFSNVESATEYKNQLLWKPSTVKILKSFVNYDSDTSKLRAVVEFLDTMISKQVVVNFKKQHILPVFWPDFYGGCFTIEYQDDYDIKFLRWCLENEDGNVETNLAISGDLIIHAVLRHELWRKSSKSASTLENVRTPMTYHPVLVEFLKWYLVTSEDYENIKAKYANDDVFAKLIKPNDQDVQKTYFIY